MKYTSQLARSRQPKKTRPAFFSLVNRQNVVLLIVFIVIAAAIGLKYFPSGHAYGLPAGVTLQQIDGGPNYYADVSPNSAWMDQHILLGGWLLEPLNATEVGYDVAMGNNIYWNLAGNPTDTADCGGSPCRADYETIRDGGMHVSAPDYYTSSNDIMQTGGTVNPGLINGSETVEFDGSDESDMNFGPGSNGWEGASSTDPYNTAQCIPSGSNCGYTVDNWYYTGKPTSYGITGWPYNGTAIHQGNGKGVLFWDTDTQAAQFMTYSDTESADSYWMTDDNLNVASQGGCALFPNSATICNGGGGAGLTDAQRELPANYAFDVSRLEHLDSLNGTSKPVVVDVETGCPGFTENGQPACITPPEMQAAAMQAIIAGARGIIWFQHNFAGPCQDDVSFYDGSDPSSPLYTCQQTTGVTLHNMVQAVTSFNDEITGLNSVLLSPFAENYVSSSDDVSYMAKYYNNNFYIFAGSGQPGVPPPTNQSVTFTLAGGYTGPITVLGENRTIQATNGTFTDTFADMNAYHVYEVGIPPPSTPTNLTAEANSSTSVTLNWDASSDTNGPGLGGYYVLRNGTQIGSVNAPTTTYTDTTATAKSTYSYTVEAYDTYSTPDISPASTAASLTTPNPDGSYCYAPFYRLNSQSGKGHFYTASLSEADSVMGSASYLPEGIVGYISTDSTSGSNLIALYRLYNPANDSHFYTVSASEESSLVNAGYTSEGIAGYISSSSGTNLTAFYRLYDPKTGLHFYTSSSSEESTLVGSGAYTNEGIIGYVFTSNDTSYCHTPLYRLRSLGTGEHFYTANVSEMSSAIANSGYVPEGTTGYIDTVNNGGDVALYRLRSKLTGQHFYTTSSSEATSLTSSGSYVSEGITGYVSSSAGAGMAPLYRLIDSKNGQHFYTNSSAEESALISSGSFSVEGVIGYVFGSI